MVNAVSKAGQVLELFTPERPEWGVSEVAQAIGVAKSSAHALLTTLSDTGLLHRMITGRYRLGFRLLAYAQVLLSHTPWRDVAQRAMRNLVEQTRETAHLAALDGGRMIQLDELEGSNGVTRVMNVGGLLPAHASALGKVLLAHRPRRIVRGWIESYGLQALTSQTITNTDELERTLEQVRANGFASSREEVRLDLCCLAAPVRNHNGEVIAAISLSTTKQRFEQYNDTLRQQVIHAALEVSHTIGYQADLHEGEHVWEWHRIGNREELRVRPKRRSVNGADRLEERY
jgi:IclR family transcriptional regulator, KDG regulon repressor